MKGTKNNKEEERKNILWLTIADKPASSRSDLVKDVKKMPIFKLKALDQKITNLLTQLKNEGKIVNVGKGRKGARYSTVQRRKGARTVQTGDKPAFLEEKKDDDKDNDEDKGKEMADDKKEEKTYGSDEQKSEFSDVITQDYLHWMENTLKSGGVDIAGARSHFDALVKKTNHKNLTGWLSDPYSEKQYDPKSKWQKPATSEEPKGRLSGLSKESVRMIMVQTEIEDKVLSQLNNPDEATELISELVFLAMTKQ